MWHTKVRFWNSIFCQIFKKSFARCSVWHDTKLKEKLNKFRSGKHEVYLKSVWNEEEIKQKKDKKKKFKKERRRYGDKWKGTLISWSHVLIHLVHVHNLEPANYLRCPILWSNHKRGHTLQLNLLPFVVKLRWSDCSGLSLTHTSTTPLTSFSPATFPNIPLSYTFGFIFFTLSSFHIYFHLYTSILTDIDVSLNPFITRKTLSYRHKVTARQFWLLFNF